MSQRSVILLGSTGSIGTQAIDVITRNPDRFTVTGLSAGGGDVGLLVRQARQLGVSTVAVADEPLDPRCARRCPASRCSSARRRRPSSPDAARTWSSTASRAAWVSARRSRPSRAGSTLALANKESLVVGGRLVQAARQRPDQIVPVDSEHSAIAQALRGGARPEVRRLVLTASGGPFRGWAHDDVKAVTPRAGARAPDLVDGTGRDDQLGDPDEQGPRAHRGAPAVRRPGRGHHRRRAPAVGRALDGRVRRRLHARPGVAARHAPADRARPELAGPGARRRTGLRLDPGDRVDVRAARRGGVRGRRARPDGGRGLADAPGRLQRRERGVRRGVPERADRLPRHRRAPSQRVLGEHAGVDDLTLDAVLDAEIVGPSRAQELLARS